MRRLVSLGLICLALLAAVTADAATLFSEYPTLAGTIQARIAAFGTSGLSKAEKAQKAKLAKVVKAMNADTDDLAKRLVYIGKTVKGVDAVYPTDGTLSPLLDEVVTDVTTVVQRRGSELFYSIQPLPDGAAKTRAQLLSDASEADVIASVTATPRSARITLLKNALVTIGKAQRVVRKAGGGGGVTTTALDVDIDGQHLHVPQGSGDFLYTVTYDSAMDRVSISVRGTAGGAVHAFTLMVPDPDLGDRVIPPGPQTSYTPPVAVVGPFLLTVGNITFTAWDPAGGKVAANFDLTFTHPSATVVLSNGSLSSTSMSVQ